MDQHINRGKLAAVLLLTAAVFFGYKAFGYLGRGETTEYFRGRPRALGNAEARTHGWVHLGLCVASLAAAGFSFVRGEDLFDE